MYTYLVITVSLSLSLSTFAVHLYLGERKRMDRILGGGGLQLMLQTVSLLWQSGVLNAFATAIDLLKFHHISFLPYPSRFPLFILSSSLLERRMHPLSLSLSNRVWKKGEESTMKQSLWCWPGSIRKHHHARLSKRRHPLHSDWAAPIS